MSCSEAATAIVAATLGLHSRVFPPLHLGDFLGILVFLLTKLDLNSRCVFCKPLPHLVVRPRPLHGAGITMIVFWP